MGPVHDPLRLSDSRKGGVVGPHTRVNLPFSGLWLLQGVISLLSGPPSDHQRLTSTVLNPGQKEVHCTVTPLRLTSRSKVLGTGVTRLSRRGQSQDLRTSSRGSTIRVDAGRRKITTDLVGILPSPAGGPRCGRGEGHHMSSRDRPAPDSRLESQVPSF